MRTIHCNKFGLFVLAILGSLTLAGCRLVRPIQAAFITHTPTTTQTPTLTLTPTVTLAPTLPYVEPFTATPQRVTLPTLVLLPTLQTPPAVATGTPAAVTPLPGDHARWVGVEPADYHAVEINGEFRMTFRFLNTGSTVWNEEYRLVFDNGTVVSGRWFVRCPRVLPGETAEVSVWSKAPHLPETYTTTWKLVNPAGDVLAYARHRFRAVLP